MNVYKIHVNDRNYTSWEVFETVHFQKVELDMPNPIESKMFSNDVFTFDNANKQINVLHSSIRTGPHIPGVLIIAGNKTFGRNGKGKLLYKCIPDDMRLPPFLVPYEIKHVGFSKVFINLYVTFSFADWSDKHPHGLLGHIIGSVDVLDNFYEYQLYCKSLNASIQQFQKATSLALKRNSHDAFIENIKVKYPSIQERMPHNDKKWHVFTIDPPNSLDFDDGFSINTLDDGIQQLSIYISNVTIWMDVLNLWNSFSCRISTIYLPDKKRPMLPTILSDCLCSLQANNTRIAFFMDIFIKDNTIIDIKYGNCFIKVFKNYCYEDNALLSDKKYIQLYNTVKELSKKYKYGYNVKNSHDLVSYLMICMNCHCASDLLKHNTGIFRSTIIQKHSAVPDTVPEELTKFIQIWNSSSGQYINGADVEDDKIRRHDLLNMDAYIHITSPIRRLVDLLNIIKFQQTAGIIQLSENAYTFYDSWLTKLDYINVTMRSIRKIQCDSTLLDLCNNTPGVLNAEYDGYVFDKVTRADGLFQFIVYLPALKLSSRITTRENIANYEPKKFKLFLFNDEEKFKRKIRMQML
jgi:exoribonuclease R